MERQAYCKANPTFLVARGMLRTISIGIPSLTRQLHHTERVNFSICPLWAKKIEVRKGGRIPFKTIRDEKRVEQHKSTIIASETCSTVQNDVSKNGSCTHVKETHATLSTKVKSIDSAFPKYQLPMELCPRDFLSGPTSFPSIYSSKDFYEAWSRLYHYYKKKQIGSIDGQRSIPDANTEMLEAPPDAKTDLINLATATEKAEIQALLTILPNWIGEKVRSLLQMQKTSTTSDAVDGKDLYGRIIELYLHVGQKPRVFFTPYSSTDLSNYVTRSDIDVVAKTLQHISFNKGNNSAGKLIFGEDLRAGVPGTLHRIGVYLDKNQERILGYTIRFGRYIPFAGTLIADLLTNGSVVVISPPCCGKTTILRDSTAQLCASYKPPKVVVVDTSNEILGDADEPAPYFGTVRRLQVSCRKAQSEVLVQAIQNHSPDIVVVDEIGNTEECEGICSIIHRGTKVLCSVHGWSLAGVVRNLKLNVLFGGSQPLLLSYEEKRAKQKLRKTALERMNPIGFQFAVQLKKGDYGKALLYLNLDKVVDRIYDTENWVCGGADLAYEVDLSKPLLQQNRATDIMKAMGK
ncbi:hypothetical protein XU18_4737 [Perkinsela sp. CCAP 1560/4]|nr:hypothetical protein XU18_4737 [Perkinsela sp. CCAP 1560/4]|eukprot:KNH03929.1 hypothetical protein XU18_4737 [Perkinsela sp. CCAP 1560/4]